jgi:hypothetical protein
LHPSKVVLLPELTWSSTVAGPSGSNADPMFRFPERHDQERIACVQ